VTAQQIGSGTHGLGVGSFGLDWATVAGFLGTPLSTPAFALMNVMAGFFLVVYVLLPVAYWSNAYDARRFPIISSSVFMANGSRYDVSRVLDPATFKFSQSGYDDAGQINLSIFFAFNYGLSFAAMAATLSHVALFHGRCALVCATIYCVELRSLPYLLFQLNRKTTDRYGGRRRRR
jgi:hypothetical protein